MGGAPNYRRPGLAAAGAAGLRGRGARDGLWLYAAMLVGTVCWSVWESGFDGWALAARLAAPFVLGAWLLTPRLRRSLAPGNEMIFVDAA